ncbi:MAG: 4'-phosphopantetheinyl transferase superfamily protein [Acidobacteriota bacterium]
MDPGLEILWHTETLADVPVHDGWLGPEELECLAAMRFPRRRSSWRLGRWTAKAALRACLPGSDGLPLPAFQILAAPDGAPVAWVGSTPAPASISLSHRDELGFCVVARPAAAVGCDVERIEVREEGFFRDYFTAGEAAWVEQSPRLDRTLLETLIWSAKESALKALREGLRRDTRSVAVELNRSGQSWSTLQVRCTESARLFRGWWSRRGDFVLTIVTDHRGEVRLIP